TASSSSVVDKSRPVVLCGPSGVGKSTLLKRLFEECPGEYGFSVSHTTRSPRPGETPGVSYHYVTREEFTSLVSQGAFLEHAQFGGNLYGTTASAVEAVSSQRGQRAILDIDAQGVKILKRDHAERLKPLYIFISPPNLEALYNRLKGRGTETPQSVVGRLGMAEGELQYARSNGGKEFDVVVVNDELDRAYGVFRKA
ncbi:guanylate kinase, partial [Jaminaea rosea]